MTRFKTWAALAACALGLAVSAVAADTIESVEKDMKAKSDALKSGSYKSTSHMENDAGGMKIKMDSEATTEFMKKDGKTLTRSDMKQKMVMGDQPPQETKGYFISDGAWAYSYTETANSKDAYKMKAQPESGTLEALKKDYDLKLLPDEKIDGKDCWVVEAAPKKKSAPDDKSKTQTWYAKDTVLPLKSLVFDNAGKQSMISTITDVKLNVDIPADRFVFKAPAGVEVRDMSNLGGEKPAEAKKDEPKKEEPKKEEPKKEEPKKEEPKADQPKKDEPKKPPVNIPGLPK